MKYQPNVIVLHLSAQFWQNANIQCIFLRGEGVFLLLLSQKYTVLFL